MCKTDELMRGYVDRIACLLHAYVISLMTFVF